MDPSIPVGNKDAKQQWKELVAIYKDVGFPTDFIEPVAGLPDMVFTANGFFSIDNKAIVARYRYKERQGETKHFKKWLKDHSFDVIDPGKICYEGEGDTFVVGDTIFQGWGFRSDKAILPVFKKTFPHKKIVWLHLINDRFYHLDTCFFPINKDLAYFYEKAFDGQSVKSIRKAFKEAVAVTDEEAHSFGLNSMTVDHTIIMNKNAKKFADRVKSDGYKTIMVKLDEFFKSGGSVKCLTNEFFWEN